MEEFLTESRHSKIQVLAKDLRKWLGNKIANCSILTDMNSESNSLVDMLFAKWKNLSPAGKLLAGGTALVWLIWLFWLPIAQDLQTKNQQTFLPTISDTTTDLEATEDNETYLPAIAGDDSND